MAVLPSGFIWFQFTVKFMDTNALHFSVILSHQWSYKGGTKE